MPKFSACIDMMFAEADFEKRAALAKENGCDGIEFWKWSDKNIPALCDTLKKYDMKAVLMNLDSSDEALSYDLSRGVISHGRADDLVKAIHETAPVMRKLGMTSAIVLAGDRDPDIPFEKAMENCRESLYIGAKAAEEEGITLVLEPLNTYDRPSYVMPYSKDAFEIVKDIGSPNLKVLLDLYHTQRMEGNLIHTLTENIAHIGHFHVANSPWRCEPDIGETDYARVFDAIDKTGYGEWVGFEYRTRNKDFDLGNYIENINTEEK